VTVDPEVAAIVAALGGAMLAAAPRLRASWQRRRRAVHECLTCGRRIVLGERTCDCEAAE
jgi:hypothetical protein